MIKGCVGFCHIHGRLFGEMILVRGKRVIHIPLFYPLYILMRNIYSSKMGKFLYKTSEY